MIWFYAKDNEPEGPIDEDALKALIAADQISMITLIWKEGMEDWTEYQKIFTEAKEVVS